MINAQTPNKKSLYELIQNLHNGDYVVPDFQREFEWEPWDICELIRSIFLDYHIGSLLLWKGKDRAFDALSCEPLYGADGSNNRDLIVLDGQQRLTALHYVFFAPDKRLPRRKRPAVYYVHIDKFANEEYDDAFEYWFASSSRIDGWLKNEEEQYAEHELPMPVIGNLAENPFAVSKWLDGYKEYWADKNETHVENAEDFGKRLQDLISRYQISYIELDKDLGLDKVCEIFSKINSRGVRLSVFDLMNAILRPKNIPLKNMWREAKGRLEYFAPKDMNKMKTYILQVMSILRQGYCSPRYLYHLVPGSEKQVRAPDGTRSKEILIPDNESFEQCWDEAVDALERAVSSLSHPQGFGAITSTYLPYISILPIFSALQVYMRTCAPNQQLMVQEKIQLWYWVSVFDQRYTSAVESTSTADFQSIKKWIEEDKKPTFIEDSRIQIDEMMLDRMSRPGSAVYSGVINLLVMKGAKDWVNGDIPIPGKLDDHHIIPVSRQTDVGGLEDGLINTVLNRTLLTADTNRRIIGDKLPNEYLPEMINECGKDTVLEIMESHFISEKALEILQQETFTRDDFIAFIKERQESLQNELDSRLGRG